MLQGKKFKTNFTKQKEEDSNTVIAECLINYMEQGGPKERKRQSLKTKVFPSGKSA